MKEIVAELASRLRASPEVNQRSGVSVRFSIGAMEMVAASALRRAVRTRESAAVPRVVDLWAALPALMGRVEFETLEEGRELDILGRALKHATLEVYRRRIAGEDLSGVVAPFEEGLVVSTSDVTPSSELLAQLPRRAPPGLGHAVSRLGIEDAGEAGVASALELCLEGLHLTKRLNKRAADDGRWTFEATPA
jgi:magnesium chelatase subunit I